MPKRFKKFRAVIFDIDGTLANTFPLIVATFNYVCSKRLGRRLAPEEVAGFFGPPMHEILRKVVPGDWKSASKEYYRYYERNFSRLVKPYRGIPTLVRDLSRRGRKLGVFTGVEDILSHVNLSKLNLEDYFETVVDADDVRRSKPNPQGVRLALNHLGVESDETILVGDTAADVRAAKAAGVYCGVALWGWAALWGPSVKRQILSLKPDYAFRTVSNVRRSLLR